MEATMFRGCLGLLVLLGVGHGLAIAQSSPPPPAAPAVLSPGLGGPAELPTQLPNPTTPGEPADKQPAAPADPAAPKAPADAAAPQKQATQPQTTQSPLDACQKNPSSQLTPQMQQALLKRTHCEP